MGIKSLSPLSPLSIFAVFAIFSIPFLTLSQIASFLPPQAWLTAVQTTYLFLFFTFVLLLILQVIRIPLLWIRDTEGWWVFRNVWVPRIVAKVLKPYKHIIMVRGWFIFGCIVAGPVCFARLGLEVDLFLIVAAHWLALLTAFTRQEEWAEGGRFLVENWRLILELFGVVLIIRTF